MPEFTDHGYCKQARPEILSKIHGFHSGYYIGNTGRNGRPLLTWKQHRLRHILSIGLTGQNAIPGHRVVMVGVKLKTMELVKRGEDFSRLKGVVSVSVVTGRYELIIGVLLSKEFGLLEFYTSEVSKIPDVQSVETFVSYKSFNLRFPYIFSIIYFSYLQISVVSAAL